MRQTRVNVTGTLTGATQRNRLDFCNPSSGQVIATCYTDSPPNWGPVALAVGQYKIKVNERCSATSPSPYMNVYVGMPPQTVTATCVNQGSY
jgi:N-acetylglutamate synthase/N-acetylornithine aminotransferase